MSLLIQTSEGIIQNIINFITQKNITLLKLVVVVCDGPNVNVENKNDAVRRLEIVVSHKLHWFAYCILMNNLFITSSIILTEKHVD